MRNESNVSSWFKGTVTNLKARGLVWLETELGLMLADFTNDTWYPEPRPGDQVECEEGGAFLTNGQWVSYPKRALYINGFLYQDPL